MYISIIIINSSCVDPLILTGQNINKLDLTDEAITAIDNLPRVAINIIDLFT